MEGGLELSDVSILETRTKKRRGTGHAGASKSKRRASEGATSSPTNALSDDVESCSDSVVASSRTTDDDVKKWYTDATSGVFLTENRLKEEFSFYEAGKLLRPRFIVPEKFAPFRFPVVKEINLIKFANEVLGSYFGTDTNHFILCSKSSLKAVLIVAFGIRGLLRKYESTRTE